MAGELPAGAAFGVDHETRRRQPSELALDAIAPLATLPVFFKLVGKRVVVAGASEAAAWKAELLAAAGARVDVFADAPSEKMIDLAARNSAIRVVKRDWTPQDLPGAAIAVGDFVDPNSSRAFRTAARAAGAAVNVIDQPEFCDFAFGSIVNRSPLVIAISTDGAAPVFGQALRARIEALTPQTFAAWAAAAKAWRGQVHAFAVGFRQRRRFWERFTALAFANADRPPTDVDRDVLIAEARGEPAQSGKGEVVLVGAGPGDAELLTLKALRALQSADVILFDDLVSPATLDLARREARRISVGKRGHGPSVEQAEISGLIASLCAAGKKVVRLKGGDPSIFGRGNEEIEAARAAGAISTIIPGVTAAFAAAASLGVSLSERSLARRVQFVTAHDKDGALPDDLDWRSLAAPDATTVVYMGVKTLPALVRRLIAAGLDPSTPAAMIENASMGDERRLEGALAEMPAKVAAAAPNGPCVFVYGRALDTARRQTAP
jgi:uroporphyrin-III C-methyltransferase / precorrin-2 dehydrogenase / sirohydrochlorin ferrochelatase